MISLWWSFGLTTIGVIGLFAVYRFPASRLGPLIGLAIQLLWILYAINTRQWWFMVSAVTYGTVNLYGVTTRRKAVRDAQSR